MTSLRNNAAEPTTSDRLLAAARDSVASVGWKRTTLTDVARRAGVSRMTVYRTYDDMATLLADLMAREWAEVVAAVIDAEDSAADTGEDWPDRIAGRVVGTVVALRDNTLFRRMVDVDPEWLLTYVLDRRGRSQDALLVLLADRIRAAQAADAVRTGDPLVLARGVVLAAHGFLLSAHTMVEDDVPLSALDEELAQLLRRYLAR